MSEESKKDSKEPSRKLPSLSSMFALHAVDHLNTTNATPIVQSLNNIGISRASAYGALDNLAAEGYITKSYTETTGGAPRVTYSTTPQAKKALRPFRAFLQGTENDG